MRKQVLCTVNWVTIRCSEAWYTWLFLGHPVANQTDIQNESSRKLILFMNLPYTTPSFALGVVFATATSFIGTYYFWMIEGGQRQLSGHHKLTLTFCSFLLLLVNSKCDAHVVVMELLSTQLLLVLWYVMDHLMYCEKQLITMLHTLFRK